MRAELEPMKGGGLLVSRELRAEPLHAAYTELIRRDDAQVVVGSIDDVVVGFGVLEIEALRDGGRLGVVSELFVDPEARAIGVGESIVGAMIDRCRQQGCIGIDAGALPGHRAAKNFFEEQGFTARALVMHKPLDTEA
jgi:GNAT superfamily N-acetyltransferase